MRILHVVAGLAQSGGGLSELVPMFAREAARQGHEVTLATVAREEEELSAATREAQAEGVRVVRFEPCWPNFLFFSWKMLLGLRRMAEGVQVVHVHSNWTFPVWWACHCAQVSGTPFVITPHGCLDSVRLRHSAWKKRLAGLFDTYYLKRAAVIHATCEAEADGVKTYLGRPTRQPEIVVIPNGVDAEVFDGVADRAGFDQRFPACKGARVVLFMSRLHPLKGLDYLLEAWRRVAGDYPGWRLVIAGPDEKGYGERLKRKVQALGLESRVTFCGPAYGEEKVQVMQNAELFVLPTRSENFGIVVAEALACGVPVITTRGAPWAELQGNEENVNGKLLTVSSRPLSDDGGDVNCKPLTVNNKSLNVSVAQCSETERKQPLTAYGLPLTDFTVNGRCGWWIDIGVEPLAAALKEAMGLTDEERCEMGENGRRLVEEKYRWEAVAERMSVVYGEIVKSEE